MNYHPTEDRPIDRAILSSVRNRRTAHVLKKIAELPPITAEQRLALLDAVSRVLLVEETRTQDPAA